MTSATQQYQPEAEQRHDNGLHQSATPSISDCESETTGPDADAKAVTPPAQIYRTASRMSGADGFDPSDPVRRRNSGEKFKDVDNDDALYDRLSPRRKHVIVAVLSFCAFLSPQSSTSVLAATPEVARTFDTTSSIINVSNAAYMVFMGVSPVVWGPMSQVFGRSPILRLTAVLFFLLSVATALAPNLASFFVFRALSAFEGTAFILLGAASIGDIYRPTERGTAIGWFLSGTLIGPAFGPFLGGVIVTYSSWRSIFWLQTALAGTGVLGLFLLVPETIHHKQLEDLNGLSRKQKTKAILSRINPIKVLSLFKYVNQVLVAAASSALVWNMYSLLTPIRYVLNPRFNLESPLLSGLFYLAPGCGYLLGTFFGGRWADWMVKRWINKRGGIRVPEDRLRSCVPFLGILMPGCILIYGWTVDRAVGGIPVPVIVLFLQGVGQLFCFPALNTYCLDVMPGLGADVTAANYFVRYLAGCLGTAVVQPAIEGIGVGWFFTISSCLLMASTVGVLATIKWGQEWRERHDGPSNSQPVQEAVTTTTSASTNEQECANYQHGGDAEKQGAR